ncbi:hypothetical protein [Pyrobaculum ferrireducens]|uniref:Uncharacterized protein n=1 Tax=Pyrobaculum ferrireducens TaxID=1104324 RepID=G7VDV0_9CREN|nr:hypothetical protein [Pyrobaculum ferrireducens]AET31532.1 hypothetical protein P186_0063 [Pyrobaculum ferrireducens]
MLIAALAAAMSAASPHRPAYTSDYICLDALDVGISNPHSVALSVYVDGEGFRPTALYVEGDVVSGVFPNITNVVYTVVMPQKAKRVCLDLPISNSAPDSVQRAAEAYARAKGHLYAVATPKGRGYLLVENRTADIPPFVKWPGGGATAKPTDRREVVPRGGKRGGEPVASVTANVGDVVGYIRSVAYNFTRYPGGCTRNPYRIALPNGTLWIEFILTNATTRGDYTVYIDIYDAPVGGATVFYDVYGQRVTVDKRSPTYLARHVDVPPAAQDRIIYLEVWTCGGPPGVLDGYIVFRVRTSDYYADYVRYPIQPGAVVVVKNTLTSPSLNDMYSNTTHVVLPPFETPPGHWVGTGALAADVTIKLCTTSSSTPPPSYFGPLNLYYGPYWVASTSVAAQSCGWQSIGGYSLYCCTYRANTWSWINAQDQVATAYSLRNPLGFPVILGPIPSSSAIVYSDAVINTLYYRGQRRPDIAPPDSSIYSGYAHNFADVVLNYLNVRGTSGVGIRIDVRTQFSGGSSAIPYIPIALSPLRITTPTSSIVYSQPDRVDIMLRSPYAMYSPGLVGGGKTLIPDPSGRQAFESISAVLDGLGILAKGLQFVNYFAKNPYVAGAAVAMSFISSVGQRVVSSAYSTVTTSSAASYTTTVMVNIGWAEKRTQHATALYIQIDARNDPAIINIESVSIWEGSWVRTYTLAISSTAPIRLSRAAEDVYLFRNFFCLFNEVAATGWICNYGGFR